MSDLIERLRNHQREALVDPDMFCALEAVLDCGEAADELMKYEHAEELRAKGCDVCRSRRYFTNNGIFSRISVHQNIRGKYVISCGNEEVPVYFCPKCGRELRKIGE